MSILKPWEDWAIVKPFTDLMGGTTAPAEAGTQLTPYGEVRLAEFQEQGLVYDTGFLTPDGISYLEAGHDEPPPYTRNSDQIPLVRFKEDIPAWQKITHPEWWEPLRDIDTEKDLMEPAQSSPLPWLAGGVILALGGIIALRMVLK